MEVKKKAFTLKAVFFKYLLTLGLAFIVAVGLYTVVVSLCTQSGMILTANYSEDLARRAKPMLSSVPEITENMIPYGCKFAVFNKEFKVVKTDLEGTDLLAAQEYAKGTSPQSGSQKSYYFIERQDGYCVLQYYVQIRYRSEFLNEHFPPLETMMIATFAILYFIIVFITTTIYAKNLKKNLNPLLQATEKIKEQDLDFDVKYSGIKEFNDVLLSISDMKTELKESLEQQWNLEQARKEQTSALAHDIKTPLTVIRGNAELLYDSKQSEEQREYTGYIMKSTGQMEQYIQMLIGISRAETGYSIQLNNVNTSQFLAEMQYQADGLAATKQLQVEFIEKDLPPEFTVDSSLLQRAIMNIVSNAVDYSPNNSKIYFTAQTVQGNIRFTVVDSGKGFSPEDMKGATKQFYMGDSSRTSKLHYGIGLYIVESIVKLHGGTLRIANSSLTGGAQVTIEIPAKINILKQ